MSEDDAIIHIVDDDADLLKAISRVLNAEGLNTKTYNSAKEFLDAEIGYIPGCVILDVRMPEMSGFVLQKRLQYEEFFLPIIFLTGHGDVPSAVNAMANGAWYFLQKPTDNKQLVELVKQAAEESISMAEEASALSKLTPREREVALMVANGMISKEIATKLDLSEKTVEFHRGNINGKINLSLLKSR